MNADELRKIGTESYDKWFERWYTKENLEAGLKQAAMEGYTGFYYVTNKSERSDYESRRMSDPRFVEKLQEKLSSFKVYYKEPKEFDLKLLGTKYGTSWTDPKVVISWKEE